jgi:hypothetical protein
MTMQLKSLSKASRGAVQDCMQSINYKDGNSDCAHCKDIIPKIRNKHFRERNCAATVPIPICERLIFSSARSAYSAAGKRWAKRGNILIAHRNMNMETGTEAAHFLFWKYINSNFFTVRVIISW